MTGLVAVYTLRVNMSVAAEAMMEDLGWTETEKNIVLVRLVGHYGIVTYIDPQLLVFTLIALPLLVNSLLQPLLLSHPLHLRW